MKKTTKWKISKIPSSSRIFYSTLSPLNRKYPTRGQSGKDKAMETGKRPGFGGESRMNRQNAAFFRAVTWLCMNVAMVQVLTHVLKPSE
jgi:hypothetical protein